MPSTPNACLDLDSAVFACTWDVVSACPGIDGHVVMLACITVVDVGALLVSTSYYPGLKEGSCEDRDLHAPGPPWCTV